MKKVVIKKGRHYGNEWPRPILWGKNNVEREESRTYLFTDSCRYDIGVDQSDKNKLFGWGWGLHHKNSVRVAWVYNPKTDMVELYLYLYHRGNLYKEKVCSVELNKAVHITMVTYKSVTNDNKVYVCISANDRIYTCFKDVWNELPCWGYTLTSYFGGNCVAPHNIVIQYEKMK